jgi:hypothetical protein
VTSVAINPDYDSVSAWSQLTSLDAKVIDISKHEAVLVSVMSVVELEIWVPVEKGRGVIPAEFQRFARIVSVIRQMAYRDEEGVAAPRHVEGSAEMRKGAIRRADAHRAVLPTGILFVTQPKSLRGRSCGACPRPQILWHRQARKPAREDGAGGS